MATSRSTNRPARARPVDIRPKIPGRAGWWTPLGRNEPTYSPLRHAIEALIAPQSLDRFLIERRISGRSWREIRDELSFMCLEVKCTHETVRKWGLALEDVRDHEDADPWIRTLARTEALARNKNRPKQAVASLEPEIQQRRSDWLDARYPDDD